MPMDTRNFRTLLDLNGETTLTVGRLKELLADVDDSVEVHVSALDTDEYHDWENAVTRSVVVLDGKLLINVTPHTDDYLLEWKRSASASYLGSPEHAADQEAAARRHATYQRELSEWETVKEIERERMELRLREANLIK